jgi:hypothetical protein
MRSLSVVGVWVFEFLANHRPTVNRPTVNRPTVNRPTVNYQLCTTPYGAVAFAESRDSLGNSICSAGRQD